MIIYSDGVVSAVVDGSTRLTIVGDLQAGLVSAGMTSILNATNDYNVTAATTPQGLPGPTFRIWDPGNSYAQIQIVSIGGYAGIGTVMYVKPGAGFVYKLLASKYHFFLLKSGDYTESTFVTGGVPYVEPFTGITAAAWIQGNSQTPGSLSASWRTLEVGDEDSPSFFENNASFAMLNGNSNVIGSGGPRLILMAGAINSSASGVTGTKFYGGKAIKEGARFTIGIVNENFGRIRCQPFDCVSIMQDHPADITTNFDGYDWWNIMHQNTHNAGRLSLWHRLP